MLVNSLFNQPLMNKYLKKYQKEFKLTHSRKEALFKWIEKLENDELKDEVSNYGNFSRLILEQILGYDYQENIIENVKEDYGRGLSEFAIKKNNKKFMVIELKGSNADLDKPQNRKNDKRTPVDQAFDYAKRSGDINWIVVSNYKEFRLYNWHKKQHQYISFKAEDLKDPETFKQFMLVFSSFSTIENNLIDKLVSKTIFVERDLEDEFYKLYNETRLMLIAEIEHLHSEFTREQSVHYSQLILNRYIFICFAEDLGLLPEEISVESIENPVKNNNLGRNEIWHRLNSLFIDVNEGNDFKKIYAYNGGLFSEDLEFLKIRDIVNDHSIFSDAYQKWKFEEYSSLVEAKLSPYNGKINPIYKNLMTISTFNFSSELDVNILGHIFENSIGDIEELKADTKGRRKKDGIFYTPEHITDYICRNTIIPYLSKSGNANTIQKLISEYSGSEIEELDEKLKNIKILDPSCGSGAFLNKAGDILLEIHKAIHEKKYMDKMDTLTPYFDNIEMRREILLNNIYGVDLNEESVEITKLSLFLKVCKKGLKLPNLNNNIKCGNSLIKDLKYTEKPFNWKKSFPKICKNNGFDLVIGNPPYITPALGKKQKTLTEKEIDFLKDNFESYAYKGNTYVIFIEKGLELLKKGGIISFITPNTLLTNYYFQKIRKIMLFSNKIISLVDISGKVFLDAETGGNLIFILRKLKNDNNHHINTLKVKDPNEIYNNPIQIEQDLFKKMPSFKFLLEKDKIELVLKLQNKGVKLEEVSTFYNGVKTGNNPKFLAKSKISPIYKEIIRGRDVHKYALRFNNNYVLFDKDKLWSNTNEAKFLVKEKIIVRQTSDSLIGAFDSQQYFTLDTTHLIIPNKCNPKYILGLINSSLINFYYKVLVPETGKTFAEVKIINLKQLPIYPPSPEEIKNLVPLVDEMLKLNNELQEELKSTFKWLNNSFDVDKLSKKLSKYYELNEKEFLNELKSKGVNIKSKTNSKNLLEGFNDSISIIYPLFEKIKVLDNQINQMVYELYDLTDEEIQIIENSLID